MEFTVAADYGQASPAAGQHEPLSQGQVSIRGNDSPAPTAQVQRQGVASGGFQVSPVDNGQQPAVFDDHRRVDMFVVEQDADLADGGARTVHFHISEHRVRDRLPPQERFGEHPGPGAGS